MRTGLTPPPLSVLEGFGILEAVVDLVEVSGIFWMFC